MRKVFHVAVREFLSTVMTKGFVIGVLITPAIIAMMSFLMPLLMNEKPPKIEGELAIMDPTGELIEPITERLTPEAIASRQDEKIRKALEEAPAEVKGLVESAGPTDSMRASVEAALGEAPQFSIVTLPLDADIDAEKESLRTNDGRNRLAVVNIHSDAVVKTGERFGAYDLFVREKMDDRIDDEIRAALRQSIIDARVRAAGLDRSRIEALTRVRRVQSTTVTQKGERETNEVLNIFIPMGFMILLMISVMTSGQQIMTTTIEEKSSRVVEVVLSAVSPMQLMTGKIIGQMCVGLLLLAVYAAMGLAMMTIFAALGLVDPWLFFYLLVFYLLSYFLMGSFMAAIGAAVNEIREAQTLMMPVMMMWIFPWVLWFPIARDPNSLFATITSFIPPINSFIMLLRMTSTTPPPLWQVWLSIAVGAVAVYFALWFAAKIFRVGLLMYGKPPNFATLVRWVRMA